MVFFAIEVSFALISLIYNSFNKKLTYVSCVNISPKNKKQQYCSNGEENLYDKIINEKESKYKVETIVDEKGNVLNKKYKDIDENGIEKGSLSYTFDNRHQLLSEIAKGSFGNYRNESYYDISNGDRLFLVKYKNNKNTPYSILVFIYKDATSRENELRPLYD